MSFWDSSWFLYLVLPLLIFFGRIVDVTLGTLRIILVSRGHKYLAPLLGFIEVLIWVVAIGKIMENLGNLACYVGYAGGFATGNFVGMALDEKLAMGTVAVRVITKQNADRLIESLSDHGFGVTSVPAQGSTGEVALVYTIIKRSDIEKVTSLVRQFNPNAFYSIGDVRYVSEGVFPDQKSFYHRAVSGFPRLFRKGK